MNKSELHVTFWIMPIDINMTQNKNKFQEEKYGKTQFI